MLNAAFLLGEEAYREIYSPQQVAAINDRVQIVLPLQSPPSIDWEEPNLRKLQAVFSGWGLPRLDGTVLECVPSLEVVFYGAGSIRGAITDAFWERGIRITTASAANAVPVAEFTVAQIILALKSAWPMSRAMHGLGKGSYDRRWIPGGYQATIGLTSLGEIGRLVAQRLQAHEMEILAYDPYIDPEVAAGMGVTLCGLDEVFARADVVSCHTPLLPTTERILGGAQFGAMKRNAAFINTARGGVVNEGEMIDVLRGRPDLHVLLDVTHPEPPVAGSPLYTLPNVFLTPHIAGSIGRECWRMGQLMIDELDRYLAGMPMKYEVSREGMALRA